MPSRETEGTPLLGYNLSVVSTRTRDGGRLGWTGQWLLSVYTRARSGGRMAGWAELSLSTHEYVPEPHGKLAGPVCGSSLLDLCLLSLFGR